VWTQQMQLIDSFWQGGVFPLLQELLQAQLS
jgi:hypothetical protein